MSDGRKNQDQISSKKKLLNGLLCSTFKSFVGGYFANNLKVVLINVDQDAILYLRVNYQHVLKKFPYPSEGLLGPFKLPKGKKIVHFHGFLANFFFFLF